jgi:menaquinone-specific isochorismate synthase
MPPYRTAPSLSLAEPRQRPSIQDWVDRSLSDALSEARRRGAPVLYVSRRRLEMGLPLGAFDSSVEDVNFFGARDGAVLGLGAAEAMEPGPSRLLGSGPTGSLLAEGIISTADASKIVLMGGRGFPPPSGRRRTGVWRDFAQSRWVVPALTLTFGGGDSQLALAARVGPSSDAGPLRARYRALVKALVPRSGSGPEGTATRDGALPKLAMARGMPSQKRWISLARSAIDSISRDELKKVVLARGVSLTFRGDVPASAVLKRLIALNPESTVFAVKRRRSVFLGASPESLMSVKKGDVEVDCLAASTPRSKDRAEDEGLGRRLLEDSKSCREHQFVVRAAVTALSPISSRVEVPDAPVLKRLTNIQHLYTPVKAKLLDGEDVWAAAHALWPNPAIGGEPREKAVGWIRRFEGLDRGWYSGFVGLMNASLDEASLVVGIRSGVVRGRKAVIFAGAGLVDGSEPQEEFEETGWKLRTMSRALGIDGGAEAYGGR